MTGASICVILIRYIADMAAIIAAAVLTQIVRDGTSHSISGSYSINTPFFIPYLYISSFFNPKDFVNV